MAFEAFVSKLMLSSFMRGEEKKVLERCEKKEGVKVKEQQGEKRKERGPHARTALLSFTSVRRKKKNTEHNGATVTAANRV